MSDFNKLWKYSDPAGTEIRFREYLKENEGKLSASDRLQVLTQIARTLALRHMFDDAHQVLDEVEKQLPGEPELLHVRYHLERGRSFNSDGKIPEAVKQFELAKNFSEQLKEDSYTIDAIHMLAIAARNNPDLANSLNEQCLILAETSTQERAKNWLGTIYNNLGWGYFDKGEFEKALSIFLRGLKWQQDMKRTYETFVAKWTVARTLRALNRIDESLTIQLGLFEEMAATGHPDGFVHEELGELYLIKNDALKAPFHFEKAYALLSNDPDLKRFEAARLERMKRLSTAVEKA